MKKSVRIVLTVLMMVLIIVLAAWLPKAVFGYDSTSQQGTVAIDTESPVGIMRAEYLARALSTSEKFSYEDPMAADVEQRTVAFKTLYAFFNTIRLPEFLYNEMSQLTDKAVIETRSINTKSGAKLPVVHIYLEWQMSWSNWLEAYIDGESGEILYLYISGSYIKDAAYNDFVISGSSVITEVYDTSTTQMPSPEALATVFAEFEGYTLQSTSFSTNQNENAVSALYSDGTNEVSYKINCIYYEDTMYDIKFEPLP